MNRKKIKFEASFGLHWRAMSSLCSLLTDLPGPENIYFPALF